jgi:hypothetical protein
MSAVATAPAAPTTAAGKRAGQPLLAEFWSLGALLPALPLAYPVEAGLPPSPKARYRSEYRPPDPARLAALTPDGWARLSDFEVALYLVDFSPLERRLAPMYAASRKGQVPFHPVSLFLCLCLRVELKLGWAALARLLAGAHGAAWRELLGFAAGATPSASGLRYFWQAVGAGVFDGLCARFVGLLRRLGRFPERSTYPGDPPERGIAVMQDGMLHPARSRPSCALATGDCHRPLPAPAPGAPAPAPGAGGRPCRAREKGHTGCACDSDTCRERCRRASRRDPEARLTHYAGGKGKRPHAAGPAEPERPRAGRDVFGYRSVAERALDDRFGVAWTLASGLYPANTDERSSFVGRVEALAAAFPDLRIGEWLGDAGVGYEECLGAIWDLGALRMVDIRAHPTDADPQACLARGYDGHGRPLCPHGYATRANGHDPARRRAKYVCAQACRREPPREGEPVRPVEGCPYLDPARPAGFVVNVGRALPDGSLRLAREVPHGSPAWRARYGRRNLAESRNGQLEGLGLKRMRAHGLARCRKDVQLADFLLDLRTLGRLVRQATAAAARPA